ncbi:MAG: DUF1573 domain-containing protein [Fuerstiella sp.]
MSKWLVQLGDQIDGPISFRGLALGLRQGRYSESTLVQQEGRTDWQTLGSISEWSQVSGAVTASVIPPNSREADSVSDSDSEKLPFAPVEKSSQSMARGVASRGLTAIALLCLIVVAAIGCWSLAVQNGRVRPGGLVIDAADLDFGTVTEQAAFLHRVTVHNKNTKAVRLTNIHGSCKCTEISPQEVEIPEGQSAMLSLKINLLPTNAAESMMPSRPFSVRLRSDISGPMRSTQSWLITGIIERQVRTDPAMIRFTGADELIHRETFTPLTVKILAESPGCTLDPDRVTCPMADCVLE